MNFGDADLCGRVHPFQGYFIMLCKLRFDVPEGFQHKMVD